MYLKPDSRAPEQGSPLPTCTSAGPAAFHELRFTDTVFTNVHRSTLSRIVVQSPKALTRQSRRLRGGYACRLSAEAESSVDAVTD